MTGKKLSHFARKSHLLASALVGTEAIRLMNALRGPNCLTVLAYHRIADAEAVDFPYYKPNVSATPEMFARQMEYVARHFNVIDIETLSAFIEHGQPLPPHALLITFDDGYLDNYQNAYPVLRALNLPAAIFVVTSRMTDPKVLWWDEVSYLFFHTRERQATIPFVGYRDLSRRSQREEAAEAIIQRFKQIPDEWRQHALIQLREVLNVHCQETEPQFISWNQARKLQAGGISIQPHTVTHPILSRIPIGQMFWEVMQSRCDVERELGQHPIAFTYPNGQASDYNEETMQAVRENGFNMSFTYTQGCVMTDTIKDYQYCLPRIHTGYRDTFEIFVMKVTGSKPVQRLTAAKPTAKGA